MNTSILKVSLLAAAASLSLLAPAAQAQELSRDTGVRYAIAAQGNAALRSIREELKFAARGIRPAALPGRPRVAAPQLAESQQRPKATKGRA